MEKGTGDCSRGWAVPVTKGWRFGAPASDCQVIGNKLAARRHYGNSAAARRTENRSELHPGVATSYRSFRQRRLSMNLRQPRRSGKAVRIRHLLASLVVVPSPAEARGFASMPNTFSLKTARHWNRADRLLQRQNCRSRSATLPDLFSVPPDEQPKQHDDDNKEKHENNIRHVHLEASD